MIRVLYDNSNFDLKCYLVTSITFRAINSEGVLVNPIKEKNERYVYIFDVIDKDGNGNPKIFTMCAEVHDLLQEIVSNIHKAHDSGVLQISQDLQPLDEFLWDNGAIPKNFAHQVESPVADAINAMSGR